MTSAASKILKKVAGISDKPAGAYNIRVDGKSAGRESTRNITISSKENGRGIDINVKPGTVGEMVHIPVVVETSGFADLVYNDFYIGEGSDVTIIAGCGIHNTGHHLSQHDGIHTFHIGKGAKVRYAEKHYGSGNGGGDKVLNPVTEIYMDEGSYFEMDSVQIEGVDSTKRVTKAKLKENAKLVIKEKIMTSGTQSAVTEFEIDLDGNGSSSTVSSRSVAKGHSVQEFNSKMNGNSDCAGHSECDAIIMDSATVTAIPVVKANHADASLIHEAAIGKIAGDQIIKLMTLGLGREDAESEIVNGFLR